MFEVLPSILYYLWTMKQKLWITSSEEQFRYVPSEFPAYYHTDRVHQGLNGIIEPKYEGNMGEIFLDEIISDSARGNRLEFRDFGVFETKRCAPRTAQNPTTLKRIQVPARCTAAFKPGRLMRERINSNL